MYQILARPGLSFVNKNQLAFKGIRMMSSSSSLPDYIYPKPLSPVEGFLKYGGGFVLTPLAVIGCGFYKVHNNHKGVVMRFGKYEQSRNEGLHWTLIPGFAIKEVFMGNQNFKLPESKVIDKNGNPIVISAVVNYKVDSAEKFVVNIGQDTSYIHNQAEAAYRS